ncbi:MAG: hypothetical protein ABJM06_12095 [Gilvibacter sp.]
MRNLLFFFFLFSCNLTLGQERSPDYLVLGYAMFTEVYKDSDSIRVREVYFNKFRTTVDTESFASFDQMLEESVFKKEDLIATDNLVKFPLLNLNDRLIFNNGDRIFEVVDESHYNHIESDDLNGPNYRFDAELKRYQIYKTPKFDIAVFHRHRYEANLLLAYRNGSVVTKFFDEQDLSIGEIEKKGTPIYKHSDFEDLDGYEQFDANDQIGVRDIISGKVVLPAKYDSINFHRLINVWQNGKFGVYDYQGTEVLPVKYKAYSYFFFGFTMVYLNFNNELYTLGINNEAQLKVTASNQPDYLRPTYKKKKNSFTIEKGINGLFNIALTYEREGQIRVARDTIDISEQYNDFYFDSGNKHEYINTRTVMIGRHKNGKYDFFVLDYNPTAVLWTEGFDSITLVPNYVERSAPYQTKAAIVFERGGLKGFFDQKVFECKYADILYAFGDFYRVQFQDGTLGWVDSAGNEYPDSD